MTESKVKAAHPIAGEMIEVLDYYRHFRNSVAHPSDKERKSTEVSFKSLKGSRDSVAEHDKMVSAPNKPEDINFHDVKLFSRILLDLLPKLDELLDPGDEKLLALVPIDNWKLSDIKRQENARIGYLVSTYGLEQERAKNIIGSLA